MTTHIGEYPETHMCGTCRNMSNVICWDDTVLATPNPFQSYPITCSDCCTHNKPHDHDYRPPVGTDHLDIPRRVEVVSVFEITGTQMHVDKLVARVQREMQIQFGPLYKGDNNES